MLENCLTWLGLLLWGIVFICNMAKCCEGEHPSWCDVFLPLTALLVIIIGDCLITLF